MQKSLLTSSVVCSVTIFGVQASLESFKKLFSRDLLSKGSGTRERTIIHLAMATVTWCLKITEKVEFKIASEASCVYI